jgi:hypothetical protein
MVTKQSKKGAQKRAKKIKRQNVSYGVRKIPALEQLIENMMELNSWQNYLIHEAARHIKHLK